MTRRDVFDDDMSHRHRFRSFGRHRRTDRDAAMPDLDDLLAADDFEVAARYGPNWQPVAETLRAAAAPPTADELTDHIGARAQALDAFRQHRRRHRAADLLGPLLPLRAPHRLSGRLAGALAGVALGVTGATTAAFASALPAGLQQFAHHAIGAPAPRVAVETTAAASPAATATPTPTATPTAKPKATKHATTHAVPPTQPTATPTNHTPTRDGHRTVFGAAGLCAGWAWAQHNGQTDHYAFRAQLGRLAGGNDAASIDKYCRTAGTDHGIHPFAPAWPQQTPPAWPQETVPDSPRPTPQTTDSSPTPSTSQRDWYGGGSRDYNRDATPTRWVPGG